MIQWRAIHGTSELWTKAFYNYVVIVMILLIIFTIKPDDVDFDEATIVTNAHDMIVAQATQLWMQIP